MITLGVVYDAVPSPWSFYGRERELGAISALLEAERFFFLRVTGRRRIGKTTLITEALRRSGRQRVAYVMVADADPAGVVLGAREHLRRSGVEDTGFRDLFGLASTIGRLVRDGWVVVLDEYQAFARKPLYLFNSALQFEVDQLRAPGSAPTRGGLIVLGSIQAEMDALLADRRAPLFGRATAVLELDHLAPSVTAQILTTHAGRLDGRRWLTLWTILQGIPKYWRDAHEVDALGAEPEVALTRLFFTGTAPLAADGTGWLLEELRGRYDPLLRYLAAHPNAPRADIAAHIADTAGHTSVQVGAWLAALEQRFGLIERTMPAFAEAPARSGRYRISDNFLLSWLGALATPVAFLGLRPMPELVAEAADRLSTLEGFALERLAAGLLHERSRRGFGDLSVSEPIRGWWDRSGAEVDLVLVHEPDRRVVLGTCKRAPARLVRDLPRFDAHVARLLATQPRLAGWRVEKIAISTRLDAEHRRACTAAGYLPRDLHDLTDGLIS
jgi:AAA+ ATPase superfamily predicted ATPase